MKYLISSLLALYCFCASAFEWKENYSTKIQALEEFAFNPQGKYQTNGLLLIKGEHILFEKYAHGFTAAKPHLLWSVSKSFASALIGIAVAEGKLSLSTKASNFIPQLQRPQARDITTRDLLQMSSGLDWNEGYESNPLTSNVVRMLYLGGQPDMASYTAQIPMGTAPGERFNYSSGESNLLCHFLRQALADDESYHHYPWNKLFTPLGIESATWERDGSGNFVCSSYLYMTPRDAARFGKLYADGGQWEGRQILSRDWIKETAQMAPAFLKTELKGFANREGHGLHWWLNQDIAAKNLPRPFPSAPESTLLAQGHHGQLIAVFPTLGAVLVRTASDSEEAIDKDTLLKLALEIFRAEER